jgi:hypothetical protein
LNFDYTYIILFRLIIFEPVTILTNAFIALFCFFAFKKVIIFKTQLSFCWAYFFLLIGLSSLVGSVAHGVHYQFGTFFLNTVVFLMNAISLIAIYFCFKAANMYLFLNKAQPNKNASYFVIAWIMVLLILTLIYNNFLLIKIHAGIVLLYSIIIHFITYIKKQSGSGWIAFGILISFFSIAVHSLKLSISIWFNYKDISHLIMLASSILIFAGVEIKLKSIEEVVDYV